ncbi:MarR family winged helix-turn-helix transcriptional regulator [Desulfuromonas acetoxidans]|uniref:Transcriptional regulator, MarR family n=1 Tax=Desulfuromonas acetoxidans (strain DSM 684 / 11070) TaxID=281689 RepID=Q1JWM7_DESA6|nr:MarR family transcriptional regulator [Desulfuromonas acetoxidans]EAT14652.1 transcriptional regulator, MarR family [Desulfuromonas acetoxidans DSM 684]MBF0645057.1 MarR family transcriptional regulator [Desulfuromonas acetoxidans]NVD23134.1 MarR family transcriptional regulator [Desulfuromonas acetoxidans]NVE15625.1 MarR family transcriptional regulator [Desulfuromonas acetoxidans]
MPIPHDLTHVLIELYDKISSWEQTVVKDSGLSPAQMHAVEIVGHHGEMRMKEMAQRMGITTGTLTVMVDRLETLGALHRQPNPKDRRSYVIVLTDKGQQLFNEHHKLHELLTREMTTTFNDEEKNMLQQLLTRLVQQF